MSFKLKLVAYFLLVSLLPLGAAAWGLHAVARRSETRRVDVRLQAGLRAVLATYKDDLSAAYDRATSLAKDPDFQRALARLDRPTLGRLVSKEPVLGLRTGGFSLGPAQTIGPHSEIRVVAPSGKALGTLIAGVPLSERALQALSSSSGLSDRDTPVVIENGRVAAAPLGLQGQAAGAPVHAQTESVGDRRYRVLAANP